MSKSTVIIIGGGASGALLAATLLRRTTHLRAIVVEPRESLGKGTAYSTDCASHLLNVPASKMSAFPGEPNHFMDWLQQHQPDRFAPHSFVQRSIYGEYLTDILSSTAADAAERLTHVRASALDINTSEPIARVRCSNGETLQGAVVVLAAGNAAPAAWRNSISAANTQRLFASAWERGALAPAHADETVVLIGSGLTAIDAALGLRENHHRGRICMISRRGALPHEHRLPTASPLPFWSDGKPPDLLRIARIMKRNGLRREHWRVCLDSVRPLTNELWKALSLSDRKRFLRHLMPYWNLHRHRMSPEITQQLASLMASNVLTIHAGRIGAISETDGALIVPVQFGDSSTTVIKAHRVINCTGPQQDYKKIDDPLIRSLMNRGALKSSELGVGVDVTAHGALVDSDNRASHRLFAIGPMRFGSLIETTAMPEIRVQAADLASHIAHLLPDRSARR